VTAEENTGDSGASASAVLLDGVAAMRPTAVFAVTDVLALGVLRAAQERGLDVPADLSIVGFDDIAASRLSSPPLTTVAQSLEEQGVQAARLALRLMAGKTARPPRIGAVLHERASTGRPDR
jgi:LacI family transcriptional regulator